MRCALSFVLAFVAASSSTTVLAQDHCGPCLEPVMASDGQSLAMCELSNGRLVSVTEDTVRVSDVGRRRWDTVIVLEGSEEPPLCDPVVVSDGGVVVAAIGTDLWLSLDSGTSFSLADWQPDQPLCAAALTAQGGLVVPSEDGVATFGIVDGQLRFSHAAHLGVLPTHVAGAGSVVALIGDGLLYISLDSGRTFASEPIGRLFDGASVVRSIDVDESGDLWVLTDTALYVLEPMTGFRLVLARSWAQGRLQISVGTGASIYVLEGEFLSRVNMACSCPAELLPFPSFEPSPRRRRRRTAGLLPTFVFSFFDTSIRRQILFQLSWPLPWLQPSRMREWRQLDRLAWESWESSFFRRISAFQRWAQARGALTGPWPPPSVESLERAVGAMLAREEASLW